jgi:hypothetical protein
MLATCYFGVLVQARVGNGLSQSLSHDHLCRGINGPALCLFFQNLLNHDMASSNFSLSIRDVSKIMDRAIGYPPETPPGCSILILSCLRLIAPNDDLKRRTLYRDRRLLIKWMKFLTAPRSRAELAELKSTIIDCRCNDEDAPRVLQNAPWWLHRPADPSGTPPTLAQLINAFSTVLCLELDDEEKTGRRLSTLYRMKDRLLWPIGPADLLPFEDHRSMEAFGAWTHISDDPEDIHVLGNVIRNIVTTNKAYVLVGIMKSISIYDWISKTAIHGAKGLFAVLKQPDATATTVEHNMTLICEAADLIQELDLILFNNELVNWATSFGGRTILDVIKVCDYVLRVIEIAIRWFEQRSLRHSRDTDFDTAIGGFSHLASKAYNLARTKPVLDGLGKMLQNSILLNFENQKDVYERLIALSSAPAWRHRCWGPECLETFTSLRRQFRVCGGCKTATYCSRKCQRAAWQLKDASHRHICRLLHRITDFKKYEKENGQYNDSLQVVKRLVTREFPDNESASAAFANLEGLRRHQFNHLRK